MSLVHALSSALTLLTCLPLPKAFYPNSTSSQITSLSTVFYPLVGLIIGVMLVACYWLLPVYLGEHLRAVIVLILWVGLTGALHIDGLADCVDAMFAGHRDPSVVVSVLKDPHVGTMAVVCVNLLLILKFCLIYNLMIVQDKIWAFLLVPAIARSAAVFFMLATPYVSKAGMAAGLEPARYKVIHCIVAMLIGIFTAGLVSFDSALVLIFSILFVVYVWRRYWMSKVGGYSGDAVGALIEIIELVIMMVFVVYLASGE